MHRRLLACFLVSALSSACSGDHDALAARPARDAGSDVVTRDVGTEDADADDLDAGDAPALDASDEPSPPEPFVLTIVNGMPDAPAIRLCFVPIVNGKEEPLANEPVPTDPAGLAYGRRMALDALPGIELATTTLRPYVVAGDLSAATNDSCAKLLDSPESGVTVIPQPLLPAGTFTEGRSALLVTTGCMGGSDHVADGQRLVCGEDYSPNSPTASLSLFAMAREAPGAGIGLQAVHAFTGGSPVLVDIAPAEGSVPVTVTTSLSPGTIAPKSPSASHDRWSLGALPEQATIRIQDPNSHSVLGSVSLGTALSKGGLQGADFVNGKSYTLVAIGPQPNVARGAWWQAFTILAIESSPTPP